MEIRTSAKNLELNVEAEQYIQKKFKRLERHLKPMSDAKLELSRTSARAKSDRVVAQMTVTAGRHTLRGQESGLNVFAAIDAVTDVMDRQIRRYKGKTYRSSQTRKSAKSGPVEAEPAGADSDPEDSVLAELGTVVRTKRFPMKPMTIEDAVMEMELLSHNFFLFYNIDSDIYNVVYRRHDGDYGVIQPEPS